MTTSRRLRRVPLIRFSLRLGVLYLFSSVSSPRADNHYPLCRIDEFMRFGQQPSDRFNCIVIDELHMLNDPERGETLEILLVKLKYSQRHSSALIDRTTTLPTRRGLGKQLAESNATLSHLHSRAKCSPHQPSTPLPATLCSSPDMSRNPRACQLIGMSATLSNAAAIGRWLDAAVYTCTVRPVPLRQFIEVSSLMQLIVWLS